jgi:hypothetical protein
MCTSMGPDSRVMVAPIPSPARKVSSRPRRLVPRMIWVAFLARANSSSVRATSSPTTWW